VGLISGEAYSAYLVGLTPRCGAKRWTWVLGLRVQSGIFFILVVVVLLVVDVEVVDSVGIGMMLFRPDFGRGRDRVFAQVPEK
jgi:hypothetical protein